MLGVRGPAPLPGIGSQEGLLDLVRVEIGEGGLEQPAAPLQQHGLVDAGALVRRDGRARPAEDGDEDEGDKEARGVEGERRGTRFPTRSHVLLFGRAPPILTRPSPPGRP